MLEPGLAGEETTDFLLALTQARKHGESVACTIDRHGAGSIASLIQGLFSAEPGLPFAEVDGVKAGFGGLVGLTCWRERRVQDPANFTLFGDHGVIVKTIGVVPFFNAIVVDDDELSVWLTKDVVSNKSALRVGQIESLGVQEQRALVDHQ